MGRGNTDGKWGRREIGERREREREIRQLSGLSSKGCEEMTSSPVKHIVISQVRAA